MATDFRTHFEKKKGWWVEENATISCILPKDGLLAVFLRDEAEVVMDANYPFKVFNGRKHWYFNDTYDRECAEEDHDGTYARIAANPQVLYSHFLKR